MNYDVVHEINFKGSVFTITGFKCTLLSITENIIKKAGGTLQPNVGAKTNYFVVNDIRNIYNANGVSNAEKIRNTRGELKIIPLSTLFNLLPQDIFIGGEMIVHKKTKTLLTYIGTDTHIAVPDGVKAIGDSAFRSIKSVEQISLPESVTKIGKYAFCDCKNLITVNIPDGVTSIGEQAFAMCTNLQNVNVPDTVQTLGDSAFSYCTKLCDKDGFLIIGNRLHKYSGTAKNVRIPDGVEQIESGAFSQTFALGAISLAEKVFAPKSVKRLGASAFSGCKNLKEVLFEGSLDKICTNAFSGCSTLETVTGITENTVIDDFAFDNCTSFYPSGSVWRKMPKAKLLKVITANIPGKLCLPYWLIFSDAIDENHPAWEVLSEDAKSNHKSELFEILLKKNNSALTLRFLSLWQKIQLATLDKYIEQSTAAQSAEVTAALLEYKNSRFDKLSIEKAEERKLEMEFSDKNPAIKRAKRMEEIDGEIGIDHIVFVATGEMRNFGEYNYYTGAHDLSDLKKFIEDRGGIFRTAVSGKTDYLICNNTSILTTKLKKAKELGVTIISEDEFLKMAEEN